jgi:hypothetical protein
VEGDLGVARTVDLGRRSDGARAGDEAGRDAGMKMARPNTAMAARMVEAACVNAMSAVGRTSVPKIELPMPTTMASTISLMPEELAGGGRVRHARMGRLVQQPAASRADRPCATAEAEAAYYAAL